jgi:hypothetical protein
MLSIYYYINAKHRYNHLKDWVEEMGGEDENSNAMLAAERDMAGYEMEYWRNRAVNMTLLTLSLGATGVILYTLHQYGII